MDSAAILALNIDNLTPVAPDKIDDAELRAVIAAILAGESTQSPDNTGTVSFQSVFGTLYTATQTSSTITVTAPGDNIGWQIIFKHNAATLSLTGATLLNPASYVPSSDNYIRAWVEDTGVIVAEIIGPSTGPAGADGADGLPGVGVTWRGEWDSGTAYAQDDAVSHLGSSYIANAASTNKLPGTDPEWDLWVEKGDDAPLDVVPEAYPGVFRLQPKTVFPGWDYSSVAAGSTSFLEIDVKPETAYTFVDSDHVFDNTNAFIFLNGAGHAFAQYAGLASETIITPKDCKQVVFSTKDANRGSGFRFIELPDVVVQKTDIVGANLSTGDFNTGFLPSEVSAAFGFVNAFGATSASIPVREGSTYYYYRSLSINGIDDVAVGLDKDDNCVALIASVFESNGVTDHYVPIIIPTGLGIVKVMLIVARNINDQNDLVAGNMTFGLVEEKNHGIIDDFKPPAKDKTFSEAVNEIVDLRESIRKVFLDKNLMIMGDSVYATQHESSKAYYENPVISPSNQGTNKLRGGACSELVRRLRPATWTNYSNGGWTMTYTGSNFGEAIYTNGDQGSYLYNLEKFFVDYDAYIADPANNDPRYAPDIFMIASCINDFLNPTEAWVTDAEVAASGKSYDQYMEDTFVSSATDNGTLIPLENIDFTKVAAGLRYIIERVYRKFPKCYIAVITSNKTSNHKRQNQQSCTRDMIWMANRLNAQVIDVFNGGNQMNPLLEFRDSVTGTRDSLYLTTDGIHHYGSVGKGHQRHGRFITNELVKGYFDLFDF